MDRDSSDRFLCPLRALRLFLSKTKAPGILQGRTSLFIDLEANSGQRLSAHAHKSQVIATIEEAYSAMDRGLAAEFKLRMHDMRMLAFSVASASGVSLDTILSAGKWKSHSTFTTFYLRSMALLAGTLYSLGPLSLPGSVVQPGSHWLTKS